MFEWLEEEIRTIKTRRFHVVDGAAPSALREAVEQSQTAIPGSYKEFVLRFGNAKLYRGTAGEYYLVGVLASPREERTLGEEKFYRIGHYQSLDAYFKAATLRGNEEAPVFEPRGRRLVEVAESFEIWLEKRCRAARRTFRKHEWAKIVAGPAPFNRDEQRIIEARRKFRWRIVGISASGDIQFEVYNGSDVVLPFLTIGVRGKRRDSNGVIEGGAWLPVASVLPAQTTVIEKDCYKKLVDPQDVEAFERRDPEPEDRDRYWEFKVPTT